MGTKNLKTSAITASPDGDAPSVQPMRAASRSGEWSDFVGQLAHEHPSSGADASTGDAPASEFATMFLATSPHPDAPPSSSRTPVGPFGLATERKLRTLDPREPSLENTRLDLFTVPSSAANREIEAVPPSYRTRIGLYFVPRDPATEPTLPVGDLDYGDDRTDGYGATRKDVRANRRGALAAWFDGLVARVRALF